MVLTWNASSEKSTPRNIKQSAFSQSPSSCLATDATSVACSRWGRDIGPPLPLPPPRFLWWWWWWCDDDDEEDEEPRPLDDETDASLFLLALRLLP